MSSSMESALPTATRVVTKSAIGSRPEVHDRQHSSSVEIAGRGCHVPGVGPHVVADASQVGGGTVPHSG
jgi:hypothetical protein